MDGVGWQKKSKGEGRVTRNPADRLILSLQWHPLSLLFMSLKECRGGVKKRASRDNEAATGRGKMVDEWADK